MSTTTQRRYAVDVTAFFGDNEPGDFSIVVTAVTADEASAQAMAHVQRITGRPAHDVITNHVEAR